MAKYRFELKSSYRYGDGHYPCLFTRQGDKIRVDVSTLDGKYALYSQDLASSWERLPLEGQCRAGYLTLQDGTLLALGFDNLAVGNINPAQEKIPYVAKVMRAENIEELNKGNISCDFALIDIPDLSVGYGDSGGYHCGVVDHGLIQLQNGDIIASMYGQFKQDKNKLDYFTEYDFYQYRSWCVVSHDNGHTWQYLSTIADCQASPTDPEAEGYCEPALLDLGGGHLLAALRTMGHEVYTPLYISHSLDFGKTWSKPCAVHRDGVFPQLVRTENGAVICSAGKVGIFLLASDDGYHWQEPFFVTDNDGKWDKGPSGYTSLLEIRPNEILLVYDETEDRVSEFQPPAMRRKVYINRYQVIKEDDAC